MPYPKEKLHHSYFVSVEDADIAQTRPDLPLLRQDSHKKHAWRMHRDTLCSFGLCPNCAQLMNVKGKGNQ